MDKNSIIGMILIAGIFFGFMWYNQPSEAELAAQKKQAEIAKTQEQSKAKQDAVTNENVSLDTFSVADRTALQATIQQFGEKEASSDAYILQEKNVNLALNGSTLSGSVNVNGAAVNVTDVVDNNGNDVALHNNAVAELRNTVNSFNKNGAFAKYLTGKDSTIVLQNDSLEVKISSLGGTISQATLKNYTAFNAKQVTLFTNKTNSYSFILNTNSQQFDTKNYYFTPLEVSDSAVLMQLDLGNGVKWGIRYTLSKHDYLVKMEVVQENMSRIIPQNIPTMDFNWQQRISRHEEGKMFEERNSGIYYKFYGGDVDNLNETSDDKIDLNDKIKWISFKNQFFSCVLIPDTYFSGSHMNSVQVEKGTPDYEDFLKDVSVKSSLDYSSNSKHPASFTFFFGPNRYPILASYDDKITTDEDLELTRLIPLGWKLFRWINTGIIIPIFDFLGRYISNYGIIILLLTLIIKIVLSPLTYKSYVSQAKMRILAPDIKAINDKYPGQENAMTRQKKTMALYSDAGASPFSGCLPMLLQMPFLFAMFTFFPSCIELRGESFLWVKDLSAPDAIISWTGQIPLITNYFGNHISLFCLLMTATNIIYTKINMQSQVSNNQMPGMKWMMYLMPLMFLVFFNNYAAGLSYYYFISLLFTIGQTYGCRLLVKESAVRAKMAENAKKPKKKSGFMARLEEAQRQQQAMQRQQAKKNNNSKGRR